MVVEKYLAHLEIRTSKVIHHKMQYIGSSTSHGSPHLHEGEASSLKHLLAISAEISKESHPRLRAAFRDRRAAAGAATAPKVDLVAGPRTSR